MIIASLFAISSFFFTYLGLILGKKVHQKIGKISTTIGGLILVILGIIYLF